MYCLPILSDWDVKSACVGSPVAASTPAGVSRRVLMFFLSLHRALSRGGEMNDIYDIYDTYDMYDIHMVYMTCMIYI